MNSKKNSFKRVAAGALAVLTVAAYSAPIANVGGLPGSILTAVAAPEDYASFIYTGLADSIVSVSDTTDTYSSSMLAKQNSVQLTKGKTVTVNSSVPLTFKQEGVASGAPTRLSGNNYETVAEETVYNANVTSANALNPAEGKDIKVVKNGAVEAEPDLTDAANVNANTYYEVKSGASTEFLTTGEDGTKALYYVDDNAQTGVVYKGSRLIPAGTNVAGYKAATKATTTEVKIVKTGYVSYSVVNGQLVSKEAGKEAAAVSNFYTTEALVGLTASVQDGDLVFKDADGKPQNVATAVVTDAADTKYKADNDCKKFEDGALTEVNEGAYFTEQPDNLYTTAAEVYKTAAGNAATVVEETQLGATYVLDTNYMIGGTSEGDNTKYVAATLKTAAQAVKTTYTAGNGYAFKGTNDAASSTAVTAFGADKPTLYKLIEGTDGYTYDETTQKWYMTLTEKTDANPAGLVNKTKTTDGYIYSFAMPNAAVYAEGKVSNVVVSTNGFFYNRSADGNFAYKVSGYIPADNVDAGFANDLLIDGVHPANGTAYAYLNEKRDTPTSVAANDDIKAYNTYKLLANKKTKFSSASAFQLITYSGNPDNGRVTVKSTYDTKSGKYVAEYTVPELADDNVFAPQVVVIPAKASVTLSKSTDGTQIVANGESAENVPVAYVAASYEKLNTTTGTTDVIKVANNTSVENGTNVKVDLEVLKKFIDRNTINTSDYVVSVTRDGQQIAKDDKGAGQDIKPSGTINGDSYKQTYEFSKAGKYAVNLTVYKQNATATGFDVYTITYNFAIGSLADLTAESVDLTATSEKLVGKNGDDKVTKVGVIDGVVEFAVDETWDGETVNVGAALFAPKKDAQGKDVRTEFTEKYFNGATYKVEGNEKSSTIGEIQTLTITYSSDSYSSTKPITVKWKLVEAAKIPSITFAQYGYGNANNNEEQGKYKVLINSIDEIANLKTTILNQLEIKNIDEKDLEFEYIDGLNALINEDELDDHYMGLPTKEGQYSVFVRYNDESMVVVNLEIASHAAYVTPAEAQLNVEFGDIEKDVLGNKAFVKLKDYTIKNAKGKTIKVELEDLKAEVKNCKYDPKDTKKTTPLFVKDADEKDSSIYETDALTIDNFNDGYLKAGTYVLSITGGSTADKEYSTANVTYILTVAPKQLTADMILIDPIEYNNGQKITPSIDNGINNGAIHAVAKYPGLTIKVAGGTTSASAIGDYNIKIGVDDGNKDYKGTVSVQWHIVKKATSTELTSLKWDEKSTAIFDNGRIHVEINRPADDQFTDKIKRYGVIIEKDGKLAEPAVDPATGKYVTTGTEYDKAKKALVVGNGFKEGNQSDIQKKNTPLIYGANINVKDPKTSIWVRPYIELENGQIYYGTVKCLNLEQEATEKLNLIMAEAGAKNDTTGVAEAAVTKDSAYKANSNATKLNKRKAIRSGYNDKVGKFYVYGSYTIPEKSENSETAVETFGVIVDKTGKIAANADKADVAKKLILGEGFIEGHADPNSKTMEADEYGANIKPKDSVTGVWVRAYVDLGNGLVVYTEPVYIKPVSDQYADQKAVFNANTKMNDAKAHLEFAVPAAPAGATVKQAGVVVDKTGSLYAEVTGVNVLNDDASAKLLLGKGYTEGKKTTFTNGKYSANVTPNTNKKIVARTYVIYTINGVDVTVYGVPEIIGLAKS